MSLSSLTRAAYIVGANNRYVELTDSVYGNSSTYNNFAIVIAESMSAAGVGTGASNTYYNMGSTVTGVTNLGWRPNNASAAHWVAVSNGSLLHLFVSDATNTTNIASATFNHLCFGDFISLVPGDAYNFVATLITSAVSQATVGVSNTGSLSVSNSILSASSALADRSNVIKVMRNYLQLANYPTVDLQVDYQKCTGVEPAAKLSYPDTATGGLVLQPIDIFEIAAARKRGTIPGIYLPTQNVLLALGAFTPQVGATGDLAGKTFMLIPIYGSNLGKAHLVVEISDTW
jgi:hypothetical protein